MKIVILSALLLSFTVGKLVEFGIKLKEFNGLQDKISFGYVILANYETSLQFKSVLSKCIEDYTTSDVRTESQLTGTIQSIKPKLNEGDEIKYGLSGDIYNLQLYLYTMIKSYYRDNKTFRINFFDLPIMSTNRIKPGKIGEIVSIEIDYVFTEFDEEFLLNFLVQMGNRSNEGSGSSSGAKSLLLPKKFSSEKSAEGSQDNSLCDCNCCTIS